MRAREGVLTMMDALISGKLYGGRADGEEPPTRYDLARAHGRRKRAFVLRPNPKWLDRIS
jgi:hypothetical protein